MIQCLGYYTCSPDFRTATVGSASRTHYAVSIRSASSGSGKTELSGSGRTELSAAGAGVGEDTVISVTEVDAVVVAGTLAKDNADKAGALILSGSLSRLRRTEVD